MDCLENFLKNYDINKAMSFESNYDLQFIALQKSWEKISKKFWAKANNKDFFCFFVLENALISYQLSGTWENRWNEFGQFLSENFEKMKNNDKNFFCMKKLLEEWTNNKRIKNIKLKRISKFLDNFENIHIYQNYKDMKVANHLFAKKMNQSSNAKTIVFGIKMFWYACRIVFKENLPFPYDISIPVDSRIKRIYLNIYDQESKPKEIISYFDKLSRKVKIPSLHIDSILWIKNTNDWQNPWVKTS